MNKEINKDNILSDNFMEEMFESAIANGYIKTEGKCNDEINSLFVEFLKTLYEGDVEISFIVDHKDTLLEEAMRYRENKEAELSCLLFATWVEHWINGLIRNLSFRQQLTQTDIIDIIKGTNNQGKFTWLLKIFNMPEIDNDHRKKAIAIMSERNNYVHYKYKNDLEDEQSKKKENLIKVISDFEETCFYFNEYHKKHIINNYIFDHKALKLKK